MRRNWAWHGGPLEPRSGVTHRERRLALARFEAALGLIDDVDAALAPDEAIVAMAAAQRFQRITDFHGAFPGEAVE